MTKKRIGLGVIGAVVITVISLVLIFSRIFQTDSDIHGHPWPMYNELGEVRDPNGVALIRINSTVWSDEGRHFKIMFRDEIGTVYHLFLIGDESSEQWFAMSSLDEKSESTQRVTLVQKTLQGRKSIGKTWKSFDDIVFSEEDN